LKIAIGLPAYNEEKNIASIIIKLKQITNTVIVCDDGSSDLTNKIASDLGATTIVHQKNLGYGAAIASLFAKAREIDADVLVTFDADGQHKIDDIKTVIDPILRNEADIVIGSRFLNDDSDVPRYRKIGIKTITGLTNATTGSKITDAQSGFRAYSRSAIGSITPSEYGMGVSTEILIKAAKTKLRIIEVPITIIYEGDTSTHNPISHGASVIFSTIKYVALGRPLSFYGIPGVGFLVVGLFFVSWTLQLFADSGEIITNVSLIGIGCTIFGTLLLMTATILHSMVVLIREQKK
jgi:glycosyltransferase involved in cell wall biosynthesis